ncbi:CPBP family intramembrane glutamic endopeptidase [Mucilaginibacter psychrotolerans]|nr:CPBP family intramembrane glutamic endopeptidase [Mucilaginibacter psychrotolerans]
MGYEIAEYNKPALAGNSKFAKVFLVCFVFSLCNGYLFDYIGSTFFPGLDGNPIDKESVPEQLFLACIVAPLIETLIFQYAVIKLLKRIGIRNFYLLLTIPAVLFGLSHYYNPLYIMAMFIGGLIMNYLFLYCQANGYKAFWWVALLHCLYNLFGILFV